MLSQQQLASMRREFKALTKETNHDVVTRDDSGDFIRHSTVCGHFIVVPT